MSLDSQDVINHQRWLINNGLANSMLNDNLYLFGIYLHPGIQEAIVSIVFEEKTIEYKLYVTKELLKDFHKYKELLTKTGKWNAIKLKRLWKKHSNNKNDPARIDIDAVIATHVKTLCGHNWNAKVELKPMDQFVIDAQAVNDAAQNKSDSEANK